MDTQIISQKIKILREVQGRTQKELANAAGLSESFISLIEKGVRALAIQDLQKIAKFFEVSMDHFLNDNYTVHFRADNTTDSAATKKIMDDFKNYAKLFIKKS